MLFEESLQRTGKMDTALISDHLTLPSDTSGGQPVPGTAVPTLEMSPLIPKAKDSVITLDYVSADRNIYNSKVNHDFYGEIIEADNSIELIRSYSQKEGRTETVSVFLLENLDRSCLCLE